MRHRSFYGLRSVLFGMLFVMAGGDGSFGQSTTKNYDFEVGETAGLLRRSDVVSAEFEFARPLPAETRFCVRDKETLTPIRSQISVRRAKDRAIRGVAFDFVADFGPLEKRAYQLQAGADVRPSEEPSRGSKGFALMETADEFLVSNRDLIRWRIKKDLAGLFQFRINPANEYVRAVSEGLAFRDAAGELQRLSARKPTRVIVTRSGPVCCGLRYEYSNWPRGGDSQVDLEFVRTKSWARVRWVMDASAEAKAMVAGLTLRLEGDESLVDIGGDDFFYTTLRNEAVTYDAFPATGQVPPSWKIRKRRSGKSQVVAVSPPNRQPVHRGWLHLMDEERCTAIAVADFARSTHDRFDITSAGQLAIQRTFDETQAKKMKSLEFWVHFVTMPVHKGARTSPQAMKSPLNVKWVD